MAQVIQMVKRLESAPRGTVVPGIELRTYGGPADIGRWLGLRQQSGLWEPSVAGRRWTDQDFRREFIDPWWWRPDRMWMAEETVPHEREGAGSAGSAAPIVGSVTLGMRGPVEAPLPIVHWLLVARPWRRQGVGRLLLEALERECQKLGHRQLYLETLSSWSAAMAFYHAVGFERAE